MMWLTFCYMFKPPHYILITGVVICFVLDSLYYLFHTSSLSLCILFYFVIARNEKKKIVQGIDPHVVHKSKNSICTVIPPVS